MPVVLVVEDDADVRELACLVGAERGLEVIEAADLAAARQALARMPDMVLLDLDLPDGHGYDLLEEIRADARGARTRVVVLTGSDRDPQEGYVRGANGWLQKPQDVHELEARLHHAFDILS